MKTMFGEMNEDLSVNKVGKDIDIAFNPQFLLDTLKIHQLQLIKGTKMAEEYANHPEHFHLYQSFEYIDEVIDFLELIRPELIVERFVSQSPSSLLAIPGWGLKNYEFVEKVNKRLEERDTHQGRLYHIV